ncbi:glycosyltransferase family 1 protein, partial [Methylophilaceae bacterium]|nr:glycosyltransferase family 1 protein [Methylophilaceae bacterium]
LSYYFKRKYSQYYFNEIIEKNNFDIYHEPNFLAFNSEVNTVITIHDLSWFHHPEVHPKGRVKFLNNCIEKIATSNARIIVDSVFTKEDLHKSLNISKKNIDVIYLGVEKSFAPRGKNRDQSLLKRYKLKYKKFILLVGTLEPRKNFITALRAYDALPRKIRKEYPLVFVGGDGWLNYEFERIKSNFISKGELRMLGYLASADLKAIISASKVFLFPSLYEGFGLPILEAMASGTPVVSSNSTCLPEVVGNAAILNEPLDEKGFMKSIFQVLQDNDLEEKLIRSGLNHVKKFTWENCAKNTMKTYDKKLG